MAEAALQESPADTERFKRVAVLLVRGGTSIIRGLFDYFHPPSTLDDVLKIQHRATLDDLKGRRILNSDQWKKLFPSSGAYGESKDFDLSLLFVLLRNICNRTAPANGWDNLPAHISDISLEDDLARIKYHRNYTFAHNKEARLSENEFNECWDEISDALLRILTFYDTSESVKNWDKEIKKLRRGPISLKDIQAWLAGFPNMMITCSFKITGYLGDVASLVANQFKDDIQQLLVAVQDVISPSQGIIAQNIYFGSIMIQLCVKDFNALEDLWKRYKNGQLKSELEKVLIIGGIKKLGKDVELIVDMSEDEYLDACCFFEELFPSIKQKMGKSFEIEEVEEMTERLKELSLDIQHGDIIIDRGSHFQAHFAEVTSKDQIDKVVGHIKKDPKYADANVVWASKLYDSDKDTIIYNSDDGDEYLAGRRLQVLLEKVKVNNIVVIATCWQGEEYLYLDIYKHINERVLSLLMRHGVIEKKSPEKLAKSLEKLEAYFQKRKQELAYAAYEMKQVGAATETPKTEFNFIHSEVIPDRKSKFQAHIAQVTSLEQVEQALAQLKTDSKIAKATYNMVAYRIYVKEKKSYLEEGRDDGENEAGRRLLHLLQISKVEDAVVIVTRWHGGVHIGPDRFKHINECANEVIKIATEKGMIATTAVGSSELSGTKKKSKGKGKK